MHDVVTRVNQIIKKNENEMINVFRHLHMNPELSFEEYETTDFIKNKLIELGIEIIDIGIETGVVGVLNGGKEGPCVGLRADIDGLPVTELSNYEYKSQKPGIMHACGHDIHASSLLGAAQVLSEMKDDIEGSVKFIFQHAEERNQGARIMIAQGVLKSPHVDAIFGMHNQPEIPVGSVGVKNGGLMAAVDRFTITVHGKGGHGGVPHRNIDPVVATAAIINSLQTIVSRNVHPKDTCVISVCSVHAGEGLTYNVIPEVVTMVGTCRSYDKELGANIEGMMRRIIINTALAYNATAEFDYIYDQPAVINPESLYSIAKKSAIDAGAEAVDPIPSTGGEDFTFFMQEIPGFMYWLGVGNDQQECVHPWHSPKFRSDERGVAIGAGVYAMSVFNAIESLNK